MTTTITIQNSDTSLVEALKSVIKLHPAAKMKVCNKNDDFYSPSNIRHLEKLKKLDDEGKLNFVTKTFEELEAMGK